MADRDAVINGLIIDEKTGKIRIGRGATGWFSAILGISKGAIDVTNDIVLFLIAKSGSSYTISSNVNGVVSGLSSGSDSSIMKKIFPITINDEGQVEVVFDLTNAETRAIKIGNYLWNGVLITDPSYDEDGEIIVEDSDRVVPFYTDGERPIFSVEEVGTVV